MGECATLWRTYPMKADHAYAPRKRCLWCGGRGHWREDCASEHRCAVLRDGRCLGCGAVVL